MAFTIPASTDAPQEARTAISSVLGRTEQIEDVLLATSELVSNAVQHGDLDEGSPIHLEVRLVADRVRVSVSHEGPPFERPPDPPQRSTAGGFGFYIVGQVAADWDIAYTHGTTKTWFEI